MSAYKKLKSQDSFVTTYVAKKNWYFSGSTVDLAAIGVQALYALSGSEEVAELSVGKSNFDYGSSDSNISNQGTFNSALTYKSLEQLYYRDYNLANGSILNTDYQTLALSGSSVSTDVGLDESDYPKRKLYEHYEPTSDTPNGTINPSGSRYLSSSAMVYSLPRDIIGTHIEPGSFKMIPAYNSDVIAELGGLYVEDDYVVTGYISTEANPSSPAGYLGGLEAIVDDGQGNLKLIDSQQHINIGNIIYSHGVIILTNTDVAEYFHDSASLGVLSYKSNQPIYTYNYHLKVSDYEYNHTLNPSALTGSKNNLRDNVSGSSFQPYITSVGLYNDANELIAVGKLSQPLVKPAETELTVQVKLDI